MVESSWRARPALLGPVPYTLTCQGNVLHKHMKLRWSTAAVAATGVAIGAVAVIASSAEADSGSAGESAVQAEFEKASAEYGVPLSILEAVAKEKSGLKQHAGADQNNSYGLFGLTDVTRSMVANSPAGDANVVDLDDPALHTVQAAAKLTGLSADEIEHNTAANVRAGAAMLAEYQKESGGSKSVDPGQWSAAVAKFSQDTDGSLATSFTNRVFASIKSGASVEPQPGQKVTLKADPSVKPDMAKLAPNKTESTPPAECPPGLDCQFIPANQHGFQTQTRPDDGIKISQIILHATEGATLQGAIDEFQSPTSFAATQYIVDRDGKVVQMVRDSDVAFGDGNFTSNVRAEQIELVGFSAEGATSFTDAQYLTEARLVKYLARKYDVPLDRDHILGHDDVPGGTNAGQQAQHWDAGWQYKWDKLFRLLGAPLNGGKHGVGKVGGVVTVAPPVRANLQTVAITSLSDDPSGNIPIPSTVTGPANFLYVHQAPSMDSPLVADQALHPGATAGTTEVSDWGAHVERGQRFVVAAVDGEWIGLNFDGQVGWIYNKHGMNTIPVKHAKIVKVAGDQPAPVYGTDFPDPADYPAGLKPATQAPLTAPGYQLLPGQAYSYGGTQTAADTFTGGTVVLGETPYIQLQFNNRYILVKQTDITVTRS